MSRIHPESFESDPSDRSVAANVLFRQEPNEEEEEEDEEEDNGEEDGGNDDNDDGYSE